MAASDDAPKVVPGMADAVEARRRALGLGPGDFAKFSGLTRQGLDDVRNGVRKRYLDKTINGVARALHWRDDWYERLAAGQEPVESAPEARPAGERSPADDVTDRLDSLQDQVRELSEQIAALTAALGQRERQAPPS